MDPQNAETIPATDEEIDASAGGCVAALSPFAPRTDDERKMALWVLRLIARLREDEKKIQSLGQPVWELQERIGELESELQDRERRRLAAESQLAALRPVSVREQFAMAALAPLITMLHTSYGYDEILRTAYVYADEAVKQRLLLPPLPGEGAS